MKIVPLAVAAALVLAAIGEPSGQSYPAKPVRFIVGGSPGGSDDFHARLIGPEADPKFWGSHSS